MPLYKTISTKKMFIAIWKHYDGEIIDYNSFLTDEEMEKATKLTSKKRWEFIMIRKILHLFFPQESIHYEENGTPYLAHSQKYISITHSYPYAALAISEQPIGIDIEKIGNKILKVQDKFINPEERKWLVNNNSKEILTSIWSMKESLYKAHHSKLWSLKKHYLVHHFIFPQSEPIKAEVFDDDFKAYFRLQLFHWENIVFTIAIEDLELKDLFKLFQ